MPGDDWISNFVKRNRLSKRTASNIIKRSRSAVNAEVINKYFDELDVAFERLGMLLSFFVMNLLKNVIWVISYKDFIKKTKHFLHFIQMFTDSIFRV